VYSFLHVCSLQAFQLIDVDAIIKNNKASDNIISEVSVQTIFPILVIKES
jgi:hypothetical protein